MEASIVRGNLQQVRDLGMRERGRGAILGARAILKAFRAATSDYKEMNRLTTPYILTILCACGLAILPLSLSAQDSPAPSTTPDTAMSPADTASPLATATPADSTATTSQVTQTTSATSPSVTPSYSSTDERTDTTTERHPHTPWGLLGLLGLLGLAGLGGKRDRVGYVAPDVRRDQPTDL